MKVIRFWVLFRDIFGKIRGKSVPALSASDAWREVESWGYEVIYVC